MFSLYFTLSSLLYYTGFSHKEFIRMHSIHTPSIESCIMCLGQLSFPDRWVWYFKKKMLHTYISVKGSQLSDGLSPWHLHLEGSQGNGGVSFGESLFLHSWYLLEKMPMQYLCFPSGTALQQTSVPRIQCLLCLCMFCTLNWVHVDRI